MQGTVVDRETGQPLVGAQIVIAGTNLGNVTGTDGAYFVNHVPVGVQRVTAEYLGYETVSSSRRVLAGQTVTVDFDLPSRVVEIEAILVLVEADPLVPRDNTISKSRFTVEDARELPVDDLEELVELGAGVYFVRTIFDGIAGFVVRGGRLTESAVFEH